MAITVNVAIPASFAGSVATVSAADVTVGSGTSRYAVASLYQREFGTPVAITGIDLESEALSQLGTTELFFSDAAGISLWGRTNPGTGASRTLTGTVASSEPLLGIGGIVYDGVDQTTPTRDVDQGDGTGTGATSASPSLTLTTESGDRVVMVVALRLEAGNTATSSGETEQVGSNNGAGTHIFIFDKTASGTSTTINPTLSFTTSDYAMGFLAVALREAITGFTVVAESGSYTLTGQSVNTLFTSILTAAQGSYALTGQDAGLIKSGSYSFTADVGSYTLVGSNALVDVSMNAEVGNYTLTGQDATLNFAGFTNPTLTAEFGSYSLTGQSVNTNYGRLLSAEMGLYALTGRQAGLIWSGAPVSTGYASQKMTFSTLTISL